jgi:hypothetical protein
VERGQGGVDRQPAGPFSLFSHSCNVMAHVGAVEKFLAERPSPKASQTNLGSTVESIQHNVMIKQSLSSPMFQWRNYDLVTFSGRHRNRWALWHANRDRE